MHNLTITQPFVVWTHNTADTSKSSDQLRLVRIMRQEERGVKAEDAVLMLLICTSLGLISRTMNECTQIDRQVSAKCGLSAARSHCHKAVLSPVGLTMLLQPRQLRMAPAVVGCKRMLGLRSGIVRGARELRLLVVAG